MGRSPSQLRWLPALHRLPLILAAIFCVAISSWRAPWRAWRDLTSTVSRGGHTMDIFLYQQDGKVTLHVTPASQSIGRVLFDATHEHRGSNLIYERTIKVTTGFRADPEYKGPIPSTTELNALGMAELTKRGAFSDPAAAAVATPGKTVVYFANRTNFWLGYAHALWTRISVPLIIGTTVISAILVARRLTRHWLHAPHCCQSCGYDQTGLTSGSPCPECGATPTPNPS